MTRRPRPTRRIVLLALVVLALAGALAACGIPTDDEPRVLLSDTATTVAAQTSAPAGGENTIIVYLGQVDDDEELVAVPRGLDRRPTVELALEAVLSPITEIDISRDYRTFVQDGSQLLGTDLADGTLTVDLSEAFYSAQGEEAQKAFAQVVLTVTDLEGYSISRVRFRQEGEAIEAFTPDGRQSTVTRADYALLDPRAG